MTDLVVKKDYSLKYNRKTGKYLIKINQYTYHQRFCEFVNTLNFLKKTDIEAHLLSTDTIFDTIELPITTMGKPFTLTITEFLTFKEVYEEELFNIYLENSLQQLNIRLTY